MQLSVSRMFRRRTDAAWRLAPAATKTADGRASLWTLIAVGAAVFVLTLIISLAIYFSSLAAEQRAASANFAASADDLASKLLYDTLAHARDVRVLSERVGVFVELSGALPSRGGYARICEPFRADPSRLFTGLSLAVNISAASRDAFEAAVSIENGVNKTMYSPEGGPVQPSPWWITNAYTNTGAEAYRGYDALRTAWTWSAVPELLDLQKRASRAGRVLSTPPLALRELRTCSSPFILIAYRKLAVVATLPRR